MANALDSFAAMLGKEATVSLRLKFVAILDGHRHELGDSVVKVSGEGLGGFPLPCSTTIDLDEKKVNEAQDGVTVRWLGVPIRVDYEITAEQVRDALAEGEEIVVEIEMPLAVDIRQGKEVVRDAGGSMKGVIETAFADLRWG
jgi:hypothetical protein